MKTYQIVRAYDAVKRMERIPLPFRQARCLAQMQTTLVQIVGQIAERERQIVEKYGGQINQDGCMITPDDEQFKIDMTQLNNEDVEVPVQKVTIRAEDMGEYRICARDILDLSDLIEFVD